MDRPEAPQDIPFPPVFSPVVTREKFSHLSGLPEGVIQGMIEKGHLPSIKIGRYRLVNLALLVAQCAGDGELERVVMN